MSCCAHCRGIETEFDRRVAKRELGRYRRRGPRGTTQVLVDALHAYIRAGTTLMDVGGGIGAIQHELLRAGVARAVHVDAASAYLDASRSEATRQGHVQRVEYHHGDFAELAPSLRPTDLVALDRVVCCYPDLHGLMGAALTKCLRACGLVYPRDTWWTRAGVRIGNHYFRLRRSDFRAFVHPVAVLDAFVRERGFHRAAFARTLGWEVAVYERADSDAGSPATGNQSVNVEPRPGSL